MLFFLFFFYMRTWQKRLIPLPSFDQSSRTRLFCIRYDFCTCPKYRNLHGRNPICPKRWDSRTNNSPNFLCLSLLPIPSRISVNRVDNPNDVLCSKAIPTIDFDSTACLPVASTPSISSIWGSVCSSRISIFLRIAFPSFGNNPWKKTSYDKNQAHQGILTYVSLSTSFAPYLVEYGRIWYDGLACKRRTLIMLPFLCTSQNSPFPRCLPFCPPTKSFVTTITPAFVAWLVEVSLRRRTTIDLQCYQPELSIDARLDSGNLCR